MTRPAYGIRIFQGYCRFINWSVAPVDYEREIKTTVGLGITGLILSLALLYKAVFFY